MDLSKPVRLFGAATIAGTGMAAGTVLLASSPAGAATVCNPVGWAGLNGGCIIGSGTGSLVAEGSWSGGDVYHIELLKKNSSGGWSEVCNGNDVGSGGLSQCSLSDPGSGTYEAFIWGNNNGKFTNLTTIGPGSF